jgi:hypothetical protein
MLGERKGSVSDNLSVPRAAPAGGTNKNMNVGITVLKYTRTVSYSQEGAYASSSALLGQ